MRSSLPQPSSLVVLAIVLITTHSWGSPPSDVSALRSPGVQNCHRPGRSGISPLPKDHPQQQNHEHQPQQGATTQTPRNHPSVRCADLALHGAVSSDVEVAAAAVAAGAAATTPATNAATTATASPSWHPLAATAPVVKDCVFKFGGSSLANAERIDHVARLIKDQLDGGVRPRVVVCSAMGKTTDALLQAGREALAAATTRTTMTTTAAAVEGGGSFAAIRDFHRETLMDLELLDGQQQTKMSGKSLSSKSVASLRLKHRTKNRIKNSVQQDVDALLQECHELLTGVQLLQELSPRSKDQLVSYGERCAVRVLAARLNQIGIPARAYDAWEVGVFTTPGPAAGSGDANGRGDARLVPDYADRIRSAFEERVVDPDVVAVVTGFIAKEEAAVDAKGDDERDTHRMKANCGGKITTLGRGGSDLTATAIGSALGVDEIQVWKDVDGILTTDPRVVPHAIPLSRVTFEEASELAHFGAQVLHPIAMEPCRDNHVPVRVKNSYNPSAMGTLICDKGRDGNMNDEGTDSNVSRLVTAITCKRDVRLLDIHSTSMMGTYGFLSKVFAGFEKHQVSVDVLASSEVSISLTLDQRQEGEACIESLIHDFDMDPAMEVTVKDGMSILTLITDVEQTSEVLSTVFRVFSQQEIPLQMMSQGASKVNISLVIPTANLETAIWYLHDCFFGDQCVLEAGLPFPRYIDNEEKDEDDVLGLLDEIQAAMKDTSSLTTTGKGSD